MFSKRSVRMALVAGLAVLLMSAMVWAQTAAPAAAAAEPKASWSMGNALMAGGWIGLIILALSVVMVALIIEHFMTIKDEKLIPREFVAELQALLDANRYKDAVALCNASDNYISRIMSVGIAKIPYGYDKMIEGMQSVSEEESVKLNQKIGYLSLIGVIGPMMGLLGTVFGMMICFNTVANSQHGTQARDLARGISMKLVCTFGGLCVAIPCMFFYSFFQDRVTNIGLEAGAVCEELIRKFEPRVKVAVPPPTVKPAAAPGAQGAAPSTAVPEVG